MPEGTIKRKDYAPYIDRISDSTIWKISLGERKSDVLYNECIKENEIANSWLPEYDASKYEGDDIMKLLGNKSEYGDKPIQDANTVGILPEMKVDILVYNSLKP